MSTDVLAFIEDPGAANFVLPIISELEARGAKVALRTEGTAASYVQRASIRRDERADELISRVRPHVLLVGTSENAESMGLSLIDAAKLAGIPTVGAVDALGNAGRRFQGLGRNALQHAPDLILVADAATAQAFERLGQSPSRIAVCGHPQHDAARARACILDQEGFAAVRRRVLSSPPNDGRPVIVFASEVSTGVGTEVFRREADYSLAGSGRFDLRTEIVIEEFLRAAEEIAPRPHLVLRMHPKNTRDELAPFISRFDEVSAGGAGLDVVYAADAVAGMTSILLVEALLIGRPVLSILPRRSERNLVSELQSGLIPIASTYDEIRSGLRSLIASGAQPQERQDSPPSGAASAAADAIMGLRR